MKNRENWNTPNFDTRWHATLPQHDDAPSRCLSLQRLLRIGLKFRCIEGILRHRPGQTLCRTALISLVKLLTGRSRTGVSRVKCSGIRFST